MPPAARALSLALLLASCCSATFINNDSPRYDADGFIMDAHDFTLSKYPGREADGYYLVAVSYGGCREPTGMGCDQTSDKCGFQYNHTVNVWRSPDLSSGSWQFVSTAITPDMRKEGTLYRPDATWNPNTGKVVLWFNMVTPGGGYAGYEAYTADSPAGPYTLQRCVRRAALGSRSQNSRSPTPASRCRSSVNITVQNATSSCGDFHLFVDPADNTPYWIGGCDYYVWIERLMPNMLDSAGDRSPTGRHQFSEYFVEAPKLFFREGVYYAVFDNCCCYCAQGSGAIVHTAPHPLGPWTTLGEIACEPAAVAGAITSASSDVGGAAYREAVLGVSGTPTPGQGCQYANANTTSTVRSQQSNIFPVDLEDGSQAWIWAGDRWQQSWVRRPSILASGATPHSPL